MPGREKLGVTEALALIRAHAPPRGSERVTTWAAGGRVLAQDLIAVRDVPAFRAAAMDGFACRWAEMQNGASAVSAGGRAGTWPVPLEEGQACAISTGAPVPDGADWIIPRELARIADGRLHLAKGTRCNPNIRDIGEDFRIGTTVASTGTWLGPDVVAAAMATGHRELRVRRWPRTAVLTTGTELDPASGLAEMPDSNGPMIAAQLHRLGIPFAVTSAVPDEPAALDTAIASTMRCDLVISTGGVSVGDHDHVRAALQRAGAQILFHGLAMRPGKPILFAVLPGGTLFFGLPGNPVAALVGLRFFVMAALRGMMGVPEECGGLTTSDGVGRADTTLYLRGRRSAQAYPHDMVTTELDQRSHILSSVIAADCWVRINDSGFGSETRVFEKFGSFSAP